MSVTIGQMAKKMGVSASALRYYDKEGLLPFVQRAPGGARLFREEDEEGLAVVECLKETGMSIREIREFMEWCMQGDSTIPLRLARIDRQREAVLAQMESLRHTLDVLDYKHWYYETAQKAGTCAVHQSLSDAEIPPEILEKRKKLHAF